MWSNTDLPDPPEGKTGWPWTPAQRGDLASGNSISEGPAITIVTPSFNQGDFIEETIRSILLQNYERVELVIIDGGSTDSTIQVIKKYEKYLKHWETERDEGQTHALNKGIIHGTGEIFNWINSDDFLEPDALALIKQSWNRGAILAGAVRLFSTNESTILMNANLSTQALVAGGACYVQPGVWLNLARVKKIGPFDQSYHYCFDRKHLMMYLDQYESVTYIENLLANYRLHQTSKTVSIPEGFSKEMGILARDVKLNLTRQDNIEAMAIIERHYEWYELIGSVLEKEDGRLAAVGRLLSSALRDPEIRLNRALLGALKRAMRPQGKT